MEIVAVLAVYGLIVGGRWVRRAIWSQRGRITGGEHGPPDKYTPGLEYVERRDCRVVRPPHRLGDFTVRARDDRYPEVVPIDGQIVASLHDVLRADGPVDDGDVEGIVRALAAEIAGAITEWTGKRHKTTDFIIEAELTDGRLGCLMVDWTRSAGGIFLIRDRWRQGASKWQEVSESAQVTVAVTTVKADGKRKSRLVDNIAGGLHDLAKGIRDFKPRH